MQRLRRLVGRRSARLAEGVLVAEGVKVLDEALRAGSVESVYLDPDAGAAERSVAERCLVAGARVFELEGGVLARVAGTVSPQAVIGVVADPSTTLDALDDTRPDLVVVCAGVRDPGNAGTVVRAAAAAGAGAVISCTGSVDLANPKTVRASAGALFHLPVVNGADLGAALDRLGEWGRCRLGASARGGTPHTETDLVRPTALVVGNEAHGLPPEATGALDGLVTIPMAGAAESLNVGSAAAVLCFEAARQRAAGRLAGSGHRQQPALQEP